MVNKFLKCLVFIFGSKLSFLDHYKVPLVCFISYQKDHAFYSYHLEAIWTMTVYPGSLHCYILKWNYTRAEGNEKENKYGVLFSFERSKTESQKWDVQKITHKICRWKINWTQSLWALTDIGTPKSFSFSWTGLFFPI